MANISKILQRPLCRVICVCDADAFLVQILQKHPENAETIGYPTVVIQKSGRIVSRSHEAKDLGISRSTRLQDAKFLCEGLKVIEIKDKYDKPDSTELRAFSNKIREAVLNYRSEQVQWADACLEKEDLPIQVTGCDEFFIDFTKYVNFLIQNGFTIKFKEDQKIAMEGKRCRYDDQGLQNRNKYYYSQVKFHHTEEIRLAYGLELADELCRHIFNETGITLSGGVASNKVLAKLACNLHKPKAVTALTRRGFYRISHRIPFRDVSGFGGELGESLETVFGKLNLQKMRRKVTKQIRILLNYLGDEERAIKAQNLVRGICYDPVQNKLMSNTVNCGKGCLNIQSKAEFRTRLNTLTQNLMAKLKEESEMNKRIARGIKIQYSTRRKLQPCSFPINWETFFLFGIDQEKVEQKRLFDEAFHAAVTTNPRFEADCDDIINSINFCVSEHHQYQEVNLTEVELHHKDN